MPGERKVLLALAILAWIAFIVLLMLRLDPSVVCSNTQPC